MILLSAVATLEKNKLASDEPFLVLVLVENDGFEEPIRLVRNNEDINYQNQLWQRFPIDFDEVTEDGKDLPQVNLKVSNAGQIVQNYLQQYRGLGDSKVKIMIISAAELDNPVPCFEYDFVVNSSSYNEEWVTFVLGSANDHSYRFPVWRYSTNFCHYHFKDIICGYCGDLPACDNTLSTCLIPSRFGGEQGIQNG